MQEPSEIGQSVCRIRTHTPVGLMLCQDGDGSQWCCRHIERKIPIQKLGLLIQIPHCHLLFKVKVFIRRAQFFTHYSTHLSHWLSRGRWRGWADRAQPAWWGTRLRGARLWHGPCCDLGQETKTRLLSVCSLLHQVALLGYLWSL